jgi:hypothetical protein
LRSNKGKKNISRNVAFGWEHTLPSFSGDNSWNLGTILPPAIKKRTITDMDCLYLQMTPLSKPTKKFQVLLSLSISSLTDDKNYLIKALLVLLRKALEGSLKYLQKKWSTAGKKNNLLQ